MLEQDVDLDYGAMSCYVIKFIMVVFVLFFFFFKQKTAYEMIW